MALTRYSTTKETALASGMGSGDTTVYLVNGSTYPDPAAGGNGPYSVLLAYGTDREEIVTVTAKPGTNVLTVARAQDSSVASIKNIGDRVVHGVSARDWSDMLDRTKDSTMLGDLTLNGDPTSALMAATKQYADLKLAKTGGTLTGDLILDKTEPRLAISGPVANTRALQFRTSGLNRWALLANTTAESGSDSGSNFYLYSYDDSGVFKGAPLSVNRQTGIANFDEIPSVDGVQQGRLTSYAPSVVQGSTVSKTTDYCKYARVGDVVEIWGKLTMNGPGTGGSMVTVSLPVPSTLIDMECGEGRVIDTSVANYPVIVVVNDANTLRFMRASAAAGGWVGLDDPNFALASGDQIRFHATYPVV